MQRISLNNFRVFGTPASFDLAPVTVLTGKNNSGKSSLIKAFLVLADYLGQDDQTVLRLDGQQAVKHRISEWKTLTNWNQDLNSTLSLEYMQGEVLLGFDFFDNQARNAQAHGAKPGTTLAHLLSFKIEVPGIGVLKLTSKNQGLSYQLEVGQKLIDYITGSASEKAKLKEASDYPRRVEEAELQLADLHEQLSLGIGPDAPGNTFAHLLEKRQQLEAKLQSLKALLAEGQRNAGIFFNAEVLVEKLRDSPTIAAIIQAGLEAYIMGNVPMDDSYTLNEIIAEYGLEEDENGLVDPQELERAEQDFIEKRAQEADKRTLQISSEQSRRTLDIFRTKVEQLYFSVDHLGANRTHQARIYLTGNGHSSEIHAVADQFQRLGELAKDSAQEFLGRWLRRFELGERVEIRPMENAAVRIFIVQGKQRVNLADMGFGAGQILVILLQIASLIQQHEASGYAGKAKLENRLILIEEPEANLHPQFQSRLAELFAEMAQSKYYLRFILETHSEYLIRNIQVLVKNHGNEVVKKTLVIENNFAKTVESRTPLFKVYYLDQPSEANGQQYGHEMRLRKDGIFMEDFGSGFLDESANLAFEIL